MRRRAFDLILVLAIVVGGGLAWTSGQERSRLTREHARLARATGDLAIGDPKQIHLVALDTGEPLNFAWRAYFPPGYDQLLGMGKGRQSTNLLTGPGESISRLRIRENESGNLEYYASFSGGGSWWSYGDKALADLLRGRWDQVRVEQLGSDGVASLDPSKPGVLLRLILPEAMQDEARRKLDPATIDQYVPELLQIQLGPRVARPPIIARGRNGG